MIKLFSDGADFDGIVKAAADNNIVGFTTNPTLMRQAGVTDYKKFAEDIVDFLAENRPGTSISLEVFSDDLNDMFEQAKQLHFIGYDRNYRVYVKIPVTNTLGESTAPVYKGLSDNGISCNVTAVFTEKQIIEVTKNLNHFVPGIVSVFAGRIADAGQDPETIISAGVRYYNELYRNNNTKLEFLWASTREPFNYIQAERCGCDIITMTPSLIDKMYANFNKNLDEYSLETVKMFYNDAVRSGFSL
jgi:transaldolase